MKATLGTFDYVFTNPPFGAGIRIDNTEVLEQYALAALWDWNKTEKCWKKRIGPDGKPLLQTVQPPEILFIERAIQLLKPGKGKMAAQQLEERTIDEFEQMIVAGYEEP